MLTRQQSTLLTNNNLYFFVLQFYLKVKKRVFNNQFIVKMTELKGKVALVTGAYTGVGAAIATKLVKLGMKVVGCARNEDKLKVLAQELNKEGPGKMFPIKCDISHEADVLVMFKYITEKFGTLHVCVNNAGVAHNAPMLSGSTKVSFA